MSFGDVTCRCAVFRGQYTVAGQPLLGASAPESNSRNSVSLMDLAYHYRLVAPWTNDDAGGVSATHRLPRLGDGGTVPTVAERLDEECTLLAAYVLDMQFGSV